MKMRRFLLGIFALFYFLSPDFSAVAQDSLRFGYRKVFLEPNVKPCDDADTVPVKLGPVYEDAHYVVVQFWKLPTVWSRDTLSKMGMKLFSTVGSNAYFARVPKETRPCDYWFPGDTLVRAIHPISAAWKIDQVFLSERFPSWVTVENGRVAFVVYWFKGIDARVPSGFAEQIGVQVVGLQSRLEALVVKGTPAQALKFAQQPWCSRVALAPPPARVHRQTPAFGHGPRTQKPNVVKQEGYRK